MPGFRVDETPVTNGQFLAFVNDGGYRRPDLWHDDDREWLRVEPASSGPPVWERDGRAMAVSQTLRAPAAGRRGRLARLREPRRGARLCALAGQAPAQRGRVPPRRLRRSLGSGAGLSVGRGGARRDARQLRLAVLGAHPGRRISGRRERVGRARARRRRMGMDGHAVRGISRIRGVDPGVSRAIPPTSSTASTSCSRAPRGPPRRNWCAGASGTGTRLTIPTSSRSSAARRPTESGCVGAQHADALTPPRSFHGVLPSPNESDGSNADATRRLPPDGPRARRPREDVTV